MSGRKHPTRSTKLSNNNNAPEDGSSSMGGDVHSVVSLPATSRRGPSTTRAKAAALKRSRPNEDQSSEALQRSDHTGSTSSVQEAPIKLARKPRAAPSSNESPTAKRGAEDASPSSAEDAGPSNPPPQRPPRKAPVTARNTGKPSTESGTPPSKRGRQGASHRKRDRGSDNIDDRNDPPASDPSQDANDEEAGPDDQPNEEAASEDYGNAPPDDDPDTSSSSSSRSDSSSSSSSTSESSSDEEPDRQHLSSKELLRLYIEQAAKRDKKQERRDKKRAKHDRKRDRKRERWVRKEREAREQREEKKAQREEAITLEKVVAKIVDHLPVLNQRQLESLTRVWRTFESQVSLVTGIQRDYDNPRTRFIALTRYLARKAPVPHLKAVSDAWDQLATGPYLTMPAVITDAEVRKLKKDFEQQVSYLPAPAEEVSRRISGVKLSTHQLKEFPAVVQQFRDNVLDFLERLHLWPEVSSDNPTPEVKAMGGYYFYQFVRANEDAWAAVRHLVHKNDETEHYIDLFNLDLIHSMSVVFRECARLHVQSEDSKGKGKKPERVPERSGRDLGHQGAKPAHSDASPRPRPPDPNHSRPRPSLWCSYHQTSGHSSEKCLVLHPELATDRGVPAAAPTPAPAAAPAGPRPAAPFTPQAPPPQQNAKPTPPHAKGGSGPPPRYPPAPRSGN